MEDNAIDADKIIAGSHDMRALESRRPIEWINLPSYSVSLPPLNGLPGTGCWKISGYGG
jgi:hypothetical protein